MDRDFVGPPRSPVFIEVVRTDSYTVKHKIGLMDKKKGTQ